MGTQLCIGIDVSKDKFDVASDPACLRASYDSDAAGIRALIKAVRALHPTLIVLESTGPYHQALTVALDAAGLPVVVLNPSWVRHFARADRLLAKTDGIDAAALARYAACMGPQVRPLPDSAQRELQALVRRRRDLVDAMAAEKKRRYGAVPAVRADIDHHLDYLRGRLAAVEHQIDQLIASDPRRSEDYALLNTAKGVGTVGAATLVALLPELGWLDHKQIAALAGVAPFNCDSGQHQGTRRCRGGRAQVRHALYMCAVSATQHNPQIKAFYHRLLDRNKPIKVALLACAHKLLTTLNAMLRDRTAWREQLAPAA